jgi:hypothetical protein
MKLIPTNEALNIVDVGLLSIRQTTQGLRKSLGKEIRKDKQRETTKLSLDRLSVDTARTKDAEKIVEAKKPQNFIKGGISSAIKGSKSIFSGLLKAAGWILLDWLLANLPKIIVIVEDVTQFVTNLYDNIVTVVSSVGNVLRSLMDTAAALSRDLISGKIFTSEREVTQEFEELTKEFSQLQLDVDKTFNDTIRDFEDLKSQSEREIADARQKLGLDPMPTTPAIPTGRSVNQQSQIAEAKEKLDRGEITQQEYNQQVETIMQPPTTLPPSPPAETRPAPTTRQQPSPGVEPQTSGLIFQDTGKKPPGYAIGDGIGAGRGHMGLDIPAESGSALTVPSDSTITDKDYEKNYGNYVVFIDANGLEHFYGHMLEPTPYNRGDKVKPGDVIGRVGSTGRSSGPHLHWELGKAEGITGYPRKNAINPMEYGFPGTAPFTGEVVAPPKRLVSSLEGMQKIPSVMPSYETGQSEPIMVPFSVASLNIKGGSSSVDSESKDSQNMGSNVYESGGGDYIDIMQDLKYRYS